MFAILAIVTWDLANSETSAASTKIAEVDAESGRLPRRLSVTQAVANGVGHLPRAVPCFSGLDAPLVVNRSQGPRP